MLNKNELYSIIFNSNLWSKDTSKLQCKKEAMKCWYLIANEIVALKETDAGCKFFKLNPGLGLSKGTL